MIFWNLKLSIMVGKYSVSEKSVTFSFRLEEVAI
jgi:hypothetical protein